MAVFFPTLQEHNQFHIYDNVLDHNGSINWLIFCWFSSGFAILCSHYEILEMTFENSFLIILSLYKSIYGELCQWKSDIHLPKKMLRFRFSPIFDLINTILQFHCKIYVWNIYITLSFQIKKIKFQIFCTCGFLCPWKVDKILQLVWILAPNKSWT